MTQPRPVLTGSISLGNLLQIGTLIVAAAIGYATVQNKVDSLSDQVEAAEAENARTLASMEARTRYLETSFARADERYNAMLGLLQSIDDRLERIERKEP